jgi:hypothetical protein
MLISLYVLKELEGLWCSLRLRFCVTWKLPITAASLFLGAQITSVFLYTVPHQTKLRIINYWAQSVPTDGCKSIRVFRIRMMAPRVENGKVNAKKKRRK